MQLLESEEPLQVFHRSCLMHLILPDVKIDWRTTWLEAIVHNHNRPTILQLWLSDDSAGEAFNWIKLNDQPVLTYSTVQYVLVFRPKEACFTVWYTEMKSVLYWCVSVSRGYVTHSTLPLDTFLAHSFIHSFIQSRGLPWNLMMIKAMSFYNFM